MAMAREWHGMNWGIHVMDKTKVTDADSGLADLLELLDCWRGQAASRGQADLRPWTWLCVQNLLI
jgi:hypothetical protein